MLTVTAGDASAAAPNDPGSAAAAVQVCQRPDVQAELERRGLNMGDCVNFVAGEMTGNMSRLNVAMCGEERFREEAGFANKGECVSTLQAFSRAQP